jgi:hypothetical protein
VVTAAATLNVAVNSSTTSLAQTIFAASDGSTPYVTTRFTAAVVGDALLSVVGIVEGAVLSGVDEMLLSGVAAVG